jgi:hypothetical protein
MEGANLNADGDINFHFLKVRLKWLRISKPELNAIS